MKIHNWLEERFSWYKNWHKKPYPPSEYFFSKAKATVAAVCPQNIKPQDPLCECKTPGQVIDMVLHTYGYIRQS